MAKKNIIIASDGNVTQIYVDGKVYGNHIEEFTFHHTGGDDSQINIKANDLPVEGDLSIEGFEQLLNSLLGK